MKRYFLFILVTLSLEACASRPKGFTYYFNNQDTGLDTLLNIKGYYTIKECAVGDKPFYTKVLFYPNGIVRVGTSFDYNTDNSCYEGTSTTAGCLTVPWGIYQIYGDTIKTQIYLDARGGWGGPRLVAFRDYLIKSKTELTLINIYCIDKNTFWCNKDPINTCPKVSKFHPLEAIRNWEECPLLKKKWFTEPPKVKSKR